VKKQQRVTLAHNSKSTTKAPHMKDNNNISPDQKTMVHNLKREDMGWGIMETSY
jgi:hypothetical protein